MGQYIELGIIYEASIPKNKLRYSGTYTTQDILDALGKNINLSLFDIEDNESEVNLSIKKDLLMEHIEPFLLEQHQFINTVPIRQGLLSLLETKDYDSLINAVEKKSFYELQVIEGNTWYLVDRLDTRVHYKAAGFFFVGKAFVECYRGLFEYMMNLIKHSTSNPLKEALVSEIN